MSLSNTRVNQIALRLAELQDWDLLYRSRKDHRITIVTNRSKASIAEFEGETRELMDELDTLVPEGWSWDGKL